MGRDTNSLILVYALAVFIRFWLITSEFQDDIAQRIEISTPLNSLYRITESTFRSNIGVDPYSSDIVHESPIHLWFYKTLIDNVEKYLSIILTLCDVLTAHILYLFAKRYMLHLYIDHYEKEKLLKTVDYVTPPLYSAMAYLFNPYIIFNCVGYTSTVFSNLFIAIYFLGISYSSIVLSTISLVLCTAQSFYPAVLISPLYLSMLKFGKSKTLAILSIVNFFVLLSVFMFVSWYSSGSWDFLNHTYGFILGVTDQQPNIGVYWYFFMEMFEHFRTLFLYSYQINVTILYFIPLTLKFRKDPILLASCFLILSAIFKSYPSVGDFGFTLALLPCWKYMYNCMQQIFISGVAIFITTALAPILWDLWIYWGSANANFYFGATLAFITAYIFILTDISFAYTKREYLLKYGNIRKINGKDAKLVLE